MLEGLRPGDTLLRREVHARFGGRQQGGIGPSAKAPVVLFFTDPATGHRHGYYDGWDDEGLFNYYGEGQTGDQRLVQGNKAIAEHVADGRTLEGFRATGTSVTYLGEFTLADLYWTEAHESGDEDTIRQVVVFRLRPRQEVPVELPGVPVTKTPTERVTTVAVEEQYTERAFVTPDREAYEIERREAALVLRYRDHLRAQGHTVSRLRVVPPGETAPLYSDLWDETTQELIEAKGGVTRNELRLAVGQLLDYSRYCPHTARSVLVPTQPRADLRSYLTANGIGLIYPDDNGWKHD